MHIELSSDLLNLFKSPILLKLFSFSRVPQGPFQELRTIGKSKDACYCKILGLRGNDIIECGIGNCNVFTAFGNNVLMSGPSTSAHLFAGSGGYLRSGNNIFIGGGGVP